LDITFIPGATAFVAALVLSGKPAHKFIFEGFLPARQGARKNRLKKILDSGYTTVFYESCHRILATLQDIAEIFGKRKIVCARELTKKFEDIRRASAQEIAESFKQSRPKGEFVVVI
jgi:16S rRNA (cytidine1402-2'-O)-methyltransferase